MIQSSNKYKNRNFQRYRKARNIRIEKSEEDDSYVVFNKNFHYSSSLKEVFKYLSHRTTGRSVGYKKRDRRQRPIMTRYPNLAAVNKIKGIDVREEILEEAILECTTALEVQATSHYDPIKNIPDAVSSRPLVSACVVITNLLTDKRHYEATAQDGGLSYTPFGAGFVGSNPVQNVRNVSMRGRPETHEKLFKLEERKIDLSNFVFQWDKWIDNYFCRYDSMKVSFSLPRRDMCYQYAKSKKASAGFIEFAKTEDKEERYRIEEMRNLASVMITKLTPKKNQSAEAVVTKLYDILDKMVKAFEDDSYPADGAFGLLRLVIKMKYEMGTFCDFQDLVGEVLDLEEVSTKYRNKLRAFWSDSQLKVLIDRLIVTPGITMIKGGHDNQFCAIGVDLIGGSFVNALLKLRLDSSAIDSNHLAAVQILHAEYPDLVLRAYLEADFSKYDSLIEHISILISQVYMAVSMYDWESMSKLETLIAEYLAGISGTHNAYKIAFVPYLSKMFWFVGRVSSGSLTTSVLDSITQIIIRSMFYDNVLHKVMKEGDFELGRKLFMTKFFLWVALVFGDDRTEGYPRELDNYIGLYKFKDYLKEEWGWILRYVVPGQIENEAGEIVTDFDYFPDVVGEVYFERRGDFIVEVKDIKSPCFLKTRAVRVYLDGKFKAILPYRKAEELIPKGWTSLSATSHPVKYLCSLSALAYLSLGNLPMYAYFQDAFYTYATAFSNKIQCSPANLVTRMRSVQDQYLSDPSSFKGLPNSMARIFRAGLAGKFPTWEKVVAFHDVTSSLEKKQPVNFATEIEFPERYSIDYKPRSYEDVSQQFEVVKKHYQEKYLN